MAETRWTGKPSQFRALLYLWRLAIHHAGYKVGGVRGWAHLQDVERGTKQALWDELPPLYRRGLLDRADVRAPGRVRPEWVYRISERGVGVVHDLAETTCQPVAALRASLENPGVYAPHRQRGGLLLLRAAHDDLVAPLRFGERGWVTGRELGARVEAHNIQARSQGLPMLAVDATDLRWLSEKGLIERRAEPAPARRQAQIIYWRVTELGRSVLLLDWKPISGEE